MIERQNVAQMFVIQIQIHNIFVIKEVNTGLADPSLQREYMRTDNPKHFSKSGISVKAMPEKSQSENGTAELPL